MRPSARPPPVGEHRLDPVAEDPFERRARAVGAEGEERKQETAHAASFAGDAGRQPRHWSVVGAGGVPLDRHDPARTLDRSASVPRSPSRWRSAVGSRRCGSRRESGLAVRDRECSGLVSRRDADRLVRLPLATAAQWPRHRQRTTSCAAFCASDADGSNLHPLPHTTCAASAAPTTWATRAGQLNWVESEPPRLRQRRRGPHDLGRPEAQAPRQEAAPTRTPSTRTAIASPPSDFAGAASRAAVRCRSSASRPAPSSAWSAARSSCNSDPSLSPDGSQVVFTRQPGHRLRTARRSGPPNADGSHLKRLEQHGSNPLWSPAGNLIAYAAPTGPATTALRLVAPQGGASRTLLRWLPRRSSAGLRTASTSPSRMGRGRLAVVNVATGKVRTLLKPKPAFQSRRVPPRPAGFAATAAGDLAAADAFDGVPEQRVASPDRRGEGAPRSHLLTCLGERRKSGWRESNPHS